MLLPRPLPAARRAVGAATAIVVLLSAVAVVVLDVATPEVQRGYLAYGYSFPYALIAVVVAGFGLWMLARAPGNRVVWVLMGTSALWSLNGLAQAWAAYAVRVDGVLPGADWSVWFVNQAGAFLLLPLPLLLLWYPTGRLPQGLMGRLSALALTITAAFPVLLIITPADLTSSTARLPPSAVGLDLDKTGIRAIRDLALPLFAILTPLAAAATVLTLSIVIARRMGSEGMERTRFNWLVWAALVDAVVVTFALSVKNSPVTTAAIVIAVIVTAGSVTIGIVRPTLVDIDSLLIATLVYAGLTAAVLVVDAVVVATGAALLGDQLEQRSATLVVLVIVALGYGPLREAFRTGARRVLLGRRDDPYYVVSTLASRLEGSDSPAEQLPAVAAAVADAFKVSYVRVEVFRASGERLIATHGTVPDRTHTLPITFRGEPVGVLILPQRGVRARLSERDEALLADVVRQAAVAARNSQLAEDLQQIREQLIRTREEERHRIRRDLHDGLGPTLGSVVLRIDHARNLAVSDPTGSDTLLRQSRDDVSTVLDDVRRLVHDLRPPALDDLGLVATIRLEAAKVSGRDRGPVVDITALDLPELPAAVEVAAYRIVSEALTNVVRHSQAHRCQITLTTDRAEPDTLLIIVSDDGNGIAADAPAGVGLLSLRERAAELGGRSEVNCPTDGGTTVRAWLPLRKERL